MVRKISIIGSGAVGSSLAFHLLSRLNVPELSLVDIAGDLAKGVSLDLEDTRAFLGFSTKLAAGSDFSFIEDSDIVVITAGIARKEGMTRLDLLKINAKVAKEVSQKIKKLSPHAIVIVVTNPLDFITYIVNKETGFNRNRILGMGSSLDTARFLGLFSQISGFSPDSLEGFVFGLHNNDMIISAERMKVKGESADSLLKNNIIKKIQDKTASRGGEIVSFLKNRSAHFAPSLGCYYLIEAIFYDKNMVIPVSVLLLGEYGLNQICMGVPCLINKNGADKIIEIKLSKEEKEKIKKVKNEFKEIKEIY
ncbi:MAG: malate dehydrogenase [Candidatus Omnitrophota bacterium]|nr:malate dehydrogenase [Candidatus Omnitrophota bacterium]